MVEGACAKPHRPAGAGKKNCEAVREPDNRRRSARFFGAMLAILLPELAVARGGDAGYYK